MGWLLTPSTAEPGRRAGPQPATRTGSPSWPHCLEADSGRAHHDDERAVRRIAAILAAKGGAVARHHRRRLPGAAAGRRRPATGATTTAADFYQLLRTDRRVRRRRPSTVRAFATQGQLSVEQLIDRYGIDCRPVRDLLVDYLRERQPALDYASLHELCLHPGPAVLARPGNPPPRHRLAAPGPRGRRGLEAARRDQNDPPATTGRSSRHRTADRPRPADHGPRVLPRPRANGPMEDPSRWGPWAAPCPIRDATTAAQRRIAAAQVPHGSAHPRTPAGAARRWSPPSTPATPAPPELLHAAQAAAPAQRSPPRADPAPQPVTAARMAAKIWAEDPDTGKRR